MKGKREKDYEPGFHYHVQKKNIGEGRIWLGEKGDILRLRR